MAEGKALSREVPIIELGEERADDAAAIMAQAFQDDPDFLLGIELTAGLSLDLAHHRFRALPGFRFHLSSPSSELIIT